MTYTHTTAHIPDEAVQAAMDEVHAYGYVPDRNDFLNMKSAIAAAIPYLSTPCAVEVVKLEWDDDVAESESLGLRYYVDLSDDETNVAWYALEEYTNHEISGVNWSKDQAKAAAQADFERRTLANVITKPVDVAAVREALEDLELPIVGHLFVARGGATVRRVAGLEHGEDESSPLVRLSDVTKALEPFRALSPAEPAQGARPLEEWHEDHGNVVWWAWDNDKMEWFGEPAYIGKPLDSDWPEYHTHWTPHPVFPVAPTSEAGK